MSNLFETAARLLVKSSPYFLVALVLSFLLVPLAKKIGFALNVYAQENQRTVHEGKIVRMGGLAIFIAFMITMSFFTAADSTINAILLGGIVIFMGGLLDDIYNLKPIVKLGFQVVAALIAIIGGQITLTHLYLPFGIVINNAWVSSIVSFLWIVGITNAINLIDGLDGLSGGISFIVTCTIGFLGYLMGRLDIAILSLILAGSILGFLPYNFYPASIFMGDCGALFLGYVIASISLLGFKTTAVVTLGFPILVLFIPISDTIIAIIRRKLKGQKISEADRDHLHHILMYKLNLGHRNTVLILYLVTALFGVSAIVSYFNEVTGLIMMLCLLLGAELFIEATGMINPKFRPILGGIDRLFKRKRREKK
ncbi:MAG: MraY family glycosyltransferase [Anaerorhabdus sp.]